MDERDRHLVRHLHEQFGTRPFSSRDAAERTPEGTDHTASNLPKGEKDWAQALEDLVKRELVIAELEGYRLTAAILRAASIFNV